MKPSLLFLTSEKSKSVVEYGNSPCTNEIFEVSKSVKLDKTYDLVYTQQYGQEYVFAQLERYTGPYVLHVGGDIFVERMEAGKLSNLGRIKKIMRKARKVICVSQFLERQIKEHIGTDNVCSLPSGMWGLDHTNHGIRFDTSFKKSDYTIKTRPKVLMAISLTVERKWKGLSVFFDAVKDIAKEYDVNFQCFGKLKKNAKIADMFARKYGVEFPGYTSDWPKVLCESDLFVHPSLWDGFPRAIADACCCGLPALVFDAGGSAEVSNSAIVVDPNNKELIARRFEQLLSSARHREYIGTAMYKEADEKTRKCRIDYAQLLYELARP